MVEANETVTIERPALTACTVSTDAISESRLALRRTPGAHPFAVLFAKAKAKVSLLASGVGFVEADTGALHVRGYAIDLAFQPKRAVVLGGFMVPSMNYLRVRAASDDTATVALPMVPGVTFVATAATATIACSDLALGGAQSFDPATALPAATRSRTAMLANRDVALSIEPKGDVVAQLLLRPASTVRVLTEGGGRARIVVTSKAGLVFGWIASADLTPVHTLTDQERTALAFMGEPSDPGDVSGLGSPLGASTSPPYVAAPLAIDELSCPSELRLMMDLGAERFFAGTIGASSVVRVSARDATFVRVSLPAQTRGWIVETNGISLLVPTSDVATCVSRPVTTDPSPPVPYNPRLPPNNWNRNPQPIPPEATVGDVQIGALSMSVPVPNAARTVAAARTRFRACYNAGLRANPTQAGRVVLTLKIAPSGYVVAATVASTSGVDVNVSSCFVAATRGLEFTAPAAEATLQVPLTAILKNP